MSATQRRSGPWAVKLRSMRSGAGRARSSLRVVRRTSPGHALDPGHLHQPGHPVAPDRFASGVVEVAGDPVIAIGAPDSSSERAIFSVSTSSQSARVDGGRLSQPS